MKNFQFSIFNFQKRNRAGYLEYGFIQHSVFAKKQHRKSKRCNKKAMLFRTRKLSAGFTLMLATLIASLMTALGMAMYTIAQKEVKLSSLGRDSQFAFYAADMGAECALYLDYAYDLFDIDSVQTVIDINSTPDNPADDVAPRCDEQILSEVLPPNGDGIVGFGGGGTANPVTIFEFELQGAEDKNHDGVADKKYCVNVSIKKEDSPSHNWKTQINSLGYNVPCAQKGSDRALERAVRMVY